jgi:hypothetical protein
VNTNTPDPGIYHDIPFADYCGWDAVSNSRLSRFKMSPAHYLTPFGESTPSLVFGSLVHCGRLEPLALAERYAVLPTFEQDAENLTNNGDQSNSKATKYYKSKVAEFVTANRGKEIIGRDEYQRMRKFVESIDRNERARRVFSEVGPVELSLVWEDELTGLRCKARIDKLCSEIGRMVDLKSTADLPAFPKSIARYGYHRQAAHYQRGWKTLTGDTLEPWLVAVESSEPHCVQAAPLAATAVMQGTMEVERLLVRLAECVETNNWPGPDNPDEWELPEWAVESLVTFI